MPSPAEIEQPIQLLVEGNDQKNFLEKLVCHLHLQGIQIQNFGGVDELSSFLLVFVKSRGFVDSVSSLGIVRDAEESAASAFQSVQSALRKARLSVPAAPGKRSTGSPAVTAYILPGGDKSGMLETLLCRSFSAEVRACIDAFFSCVDAPPGSQPAHRRDKARAHAYLATKAEPHVSVGVAAQKSYWPLDHPVFADLRNFLTSL